jgi:hypothetical protein
MPMCGPNDSAPSDTRRAVKSSSLSNDEPAYAWTGKCFEPPVATCEKMCESNTILAGGLVRAIAANAHSGADSWIDSEFS